jgi:hypothetical protein
MATIEIHDGFNQMLTGEYTLTSMLVEDHVTGTGSQYDKRNSYNTVSGHPYFNTGDPITSFPHMNTLRKVLTADHGDAIPPKSLTTGGEYVNTYTADISAYNSDHLYIIAFICKKGNSPTTYEVMNVQKAKAGTTKNWD